MAEVIRYVDPDATPNGNDGTTWEKAYLSLSAWNTGEATDLVTAQDWHHVYCRSSSGTADTTELSITGWDTSADYYIKIEAASGDRAVASGWDTSRYRLSITDPSNNGAIEIGESYVTLDGLQVEEIYSSSANLKVIYSAHSAGVVTISGCRLRGDANASAGEQEGIRSLDAGQDFTIYNTIIERLKGRGMIIGGGDNYVYNCIIYNCGADGIYGYDAGNWTIKNCAVFVTDDDFNDQTSGSWTLDYNASDDGDGSHDVAESGGGANWPDDFEDAANGDFTLKSGSNLVGAGVDDPGSGLYSDDINGAARTSTWDVGADEYIAAGGGSVIPIILQMRRRRA